MTDDRDVSLQASAMSKRGSSLGGLARARRLDPEMRREIAQRAAAARWGNNIHVASHTGDLVIGELRLRCAVLDDGTRLLSQSTVLEALGRNPQKSRRPRGESTDLRPPFLLANNLQPFIRAELSAIVEPIAYRVQGEAGRQWGYRAEMLPMVCEVYLEARDQRKLAPKQHSVARAAEILVRGLARVGIIALVDEATGYQEIRARNELQAILEAYVQAELRPWIKRFPDEFFRQIYRLQGWEYKPGTSKRTPYVGKLINKYVYDQLPPGVKEELVNLNPKNEKGHRAHKHFQFLTEETGVPSLDRQIANVTMLMRIARDKADFEELFERAYLPQQRLPLVIDIPES